MTRRRIGVITPGFAETGLPAVVDFVAALAARHDVQVISLRHPSARPPFAHRGATVIALGGGTRGGLIGRGRLMVRAVAAIVRLHRERPFAHLHGLWADEAGAVAVVAGRVIRRPVIVSVLGGELVALPDIGYGAALGRGGRWSVALALRWARLVTVGSTPMLQALAHRVPTERRALTPLAVDLSLFSASPLAAGGGARTVLFVGSLEPVKDPVALLRAFAIVVADRPDVRLDIVGDGSLRPGLERLADRLGIAHRVAFLGHLPRESLPERYRSATLLAVTSRHEAQGMVALEAAACGLPVVGTRVGMLVDLGDAALTVPVGDHRAFANAMATVLDDHQLRAHMSTVARPAARVAVGRAFTRSSIDLGTTPSPASPTAVEAATPLVARRLGDVDLPK